MENKTLLKMRLERKQAQLEAAYNAYTALLKGGVQSYTIGSRSLTRLDLPSLEETIAKLEQEIDMLEGQIAGRSQERHLGLFHETFRKMLLMTHLCYKNT